MVIPIHIEQMNENHLNAGEYPLGETVARTRAGSGKKWVVLFLKLHDIPNLLHSHLNCYR